MKASFELIISFQAHHVAELFRLCCPYCHGVCFLASFSERRRELRDRDHGRHCINSRQHRADGPCMWSGEGKGKVKVTGTWNRTDRQRNPSRDDGADVSPVRRLEVSPHLWFPGVKGNQQALEAHVFPPIRCRSAYISADYLLDLWEQFNVS
jgi:hypothetical protein